MLTGVGGGTGGGYIPSMLHWLAKGTAQNAGPQTLTLPNVTLKQGSVLTVAATIASTDEGSSISSILWNGQALNATTIAAGTSGATYGVVTLQMRQLSNVTAGTGNIVVSTTGGTVGGMALIASEIQDATAVGWEIGTDGEAFGTSATASVSNTPGQAKEVQLGWVVTIPASFDDGTWAAGLTRLQEVTCPAIVNDIIGGPINGWRLSEAGRVTSTLGAKVITKNLSGVTDWAIGGGFVKLA